jgi:hypothetical protein
MFYIIFGVLMGLGTAVGIAFIICASSLLKSNDFGDTTIPIDTYTGYTPPRIEYGGVVNDSGFGMKVGNIDLW